MVRKGILWALRIGLSIKEEVNKGSNVIFIRIFPNGESEINFTYEKKLKGGNK